MSTTWMPIYTGDYLKNTMHLNAEEHGAYFLLMCHYWQHGKIKNDKKTIQNIAKLSLKKLENVLAFFTLNEGYFIHERIEEEKQQAIDNKERQRKRTEAATRARHPKKPSVTGNVTPSVTDTPSPSPSPLSKEESKKNIKKSFEDFWKEYPNKKKQPSAEKAYRKALAIAEPDVIFAGLRAYIANKPGWQEWAHPSTWLNEQRWNDVWPEKPPEEKSVREMLDEIEKQKQEKENAGEAIH